MQEGPAGWGLPLYERVLDRVGVGPGDALLDLGCGSGLFCRLAADRGAVVSGIDADPGLLAEAARLVPEGDFRVGDIAALPHPSGAFDAVTCVQALMHIPNPLRALREAARVARPGAAVAVTVWGPEEDCEVRAFGAALSPLLPRAPARAGPVGPPPLGADGRLAKLAGLAGLTVRETGAVSAAFRFPDSDALLRTAVASALGRRALHRAGGSAVRRAVLDGLARYRGPDGGYHLDNTFRYLVATV